MKNEKYTKEALDLSQEANIVLEPFFKKYIELGYSSREISHILQLQVFESELKQNL